MNAVEIIVSAGWVMRGVPFGSRKVMAGIVSVTTDGIIGVTMIATDSAFTVAVDELVSCSECDAEKLEELIRLGAIVDDVVVSMESVDATEEVFV
jgi:hypothetical protein